MVRYLIAARKYVGHCDRDHTDIWSPSLPDWERELTSKHHVARHDRLLFRS
jgi:hypothetical protein